MGESGHYVTYHSTLREAEKQFPLLAKPRTLAKPPVISVPSFKTEGFSLRRSLRSIALGG